MLPSMLGESKSRDVKQRVHVWIEFCGIRGIEFVLEKQRVRLQPFATL